MSDSENAGHAAILASHGGPRHLDYLQALRFLAATAVVIFHALGTASTYFPDTPARIFSVFRYGDYGVDLFFVISGFIICYATPTDRLGPIGFMTRRLERIVPIYWIMTLLMVALALMLPAAFTGTSWINARSIILSLSFTSFIDAKMPIVFVGWSLEYELLFYLSVALLMVRGDKVWDTTVILLSTLAIFHKVPVMGTPGNIAQFVTNPLILEFAFGILVARLFMGRSISPAALTAAAIATLSVVIVDPIHRIVVMGLPAAMIVYAAAKLSRSRTTSARVLVFLGDASYSIYLLHIFVVSAAMKVAVRVLPLPVDALILLTTLTAIVSGCVVYVLIERPLLHFCRRPRRYERPLQSDNVETKVAAMAGGRRP